MYLLKIRWIRGHCLAHPYLAKDVHRLLRNKFLSYLAFILSVDHPRHDYTRNTMNIPTLSSCCHDVDLHSIYFLLNGSRDSPRLLFNIIFRVSSYISISKTRTTFHIPHSTHTTSYEYNYTFSYKKLILLPKYVICLGLK